MKSEHRNPDNFLLSIVVPVFNEREVFTRALDAIMKVPYTKEVIIVDDASTDGTRDIILKIEHPEARVFLHEKNGGKGRAIQTAFEHLRGDIAIIQDADLEYDPSEYPLLLEPILSGRADVVYGSRFAGNESLHVPHLSFYLGNRFLTALSNLFSGLSLTDMETCYKVFTREALKGITINEDGFGFEPEITAKIAKKKLRITEVPISYYGRSLKEGKKVKWRDGLRAVWCIARYNMFG